MSAMGGFWQQRGCPRVKWSSFLADVRIPGCPKHPDFVLLKEKADKHGYMLWFVVELMMSKLCIPLFVNDGWVSGVERPTSSILT